MRKAFTLIEVLVATAIISVVALALLQTHSNNTKLMRHIDKQYRTRELFSVVLLNAQKSWDGSTKSLHNILSRKFNIKDGDTIRWLKDNSIKYDQDELSSINLIDTDLGEFASGVGNIDKSSLPNITLLLDKVSMGTENGGVSGYTIALQ